MAAKYLILLLLLPVFAWAQDTVDARLAGPMVKALQAEIALRDAIIKSLLEDQTKREADLKNWFKAWFNNDN